MADTPPTTYVMEHIGSGNVQIFPLFGTQILGSQIGSDVGTGGPALATLEPNSVSFNHSRIIEFLDDVFCVVGDGAAGNSIGVYKRNQGGSGAWGRVHTPTAGFSGISGLHIMYPLDVPTLVFLSIGESDGDLYLHTTTNGTTWNETNVLADASTGLTTGYSAVYRNIIFWLIDNDFYQYNFDTTSASRPISGGMNQVSTGYTGGSIHVHNNVPYAMWNNTSLTGAPLKIFRYNAGTFGSTINGEIYSFSDATPACRSGTGGLLFTDPASGDLIALTNTSSLQIGTLVWVINNPEGSTTSTNISSTVMGAIEGANVYLPGGASADPNRKWQILYDNDTDPTNPRIYFRTWVSGGGAVVWQWQGTGAEMQRVSLSSISGDNYARPVTTRGGGNYFVGGSARAELNDGSNPPVEVAGGTKWYFRIYGTGTGTMSVYYNTNELAPDSLATLTGSVTVESGTPATTPSRSGNTIINLTGDDGATLYSFIHDATSDGISPGDTYTLMADIV